MATTGSSVPPATGGSLPAAGGSTATPSAASGSQSLPSAGSTAASSSGSSGGSSVPSGASSGTPMSTDQFSLILTAINSSQKNFEKKLEEFRAEVRQGQEDTATRVLKRSRLLEKPYVYRRKGNEEQAKFIDKVEDVLAEANSELSQVAPSSSPAIAVPRKPLNQV